jgi:hypothetical protein
MSNSSQDVRGGIVVENYSGSSDSLHLQQQIVLAETVSITNRHHQYHHPQYQQQHYHYRYHHHNNHHHHYQNQQSQLVNYSRQKKTRTISSRRNSVRTMHLSGETQTQHQTTVKTNQLPDYALSADLLAERTLDCLLAEHPGELVRTGKLFLIIFL